MEMETRHICIGQYKSSENGAIRAEPHLNVAEEKTSVV